MNPRLHDDAVADLPLSTARAELLEEIMSTPVLGRPSPGTDDPRRRRWLMPVVAAATVAGLLVVPSYLLTRGDGPREVPSPAASSPTAPTSRDWVVLEADGWTATSVSDADGWRQVHYEKGEAYLDVTLTPAEYRDRRVKDRQRINHPEVDPGTPVRLLGQDARMWPYAATDHTTIGSVESDVFPEVRASGMDEPTYLALLDQLAWTDEAGFEASLPEKFVTADEQPSAVSAMMSDMAVPAGFELPELPEKDPYQLGARVTGAVACAWIEVFADAKAEGDRETAQGAARALADSRGWGVLKDMAAEGDYPNWIWEVADQVQAGKVPEGYRHGLGCP